MNKDTKIITIKPIIDISELHTFRANPAVRQTKITKETAKKLSEFDETKKAAIKKGEILAIKPELEQLVDSLPEYIGLSTFDEVISQLKKINDLLERLGYKTYSMSPDNVKDLVNEEAEKLANEKIDALKKEIDSLKEENNKLKREDSVIRDTINEYANETNAFDKSNSSDEAFVEEEINKLVA